MSSERQIRIGNNSALLSFVISIGFFIWSLIMSDFDMFGGTFVLLFCISGFNVLALISVLSHIFMDAENKSKLLKTAFYLLLSILFAFICTLPLIFGYF